MATECMLGRYCLLLKFQFEYKLFIFYVSHNDFCDIRVNCNLVDVATFGGIGAIFSLQLSSRSQNRPF